MRLGWKRRSNPVKISVFQPFQKVTTPRTPDSGYDSLGSAPLKPIVFAPLIAEGIGSGTQLEPGLYTATMVYAGSVEGTGVGIQLHSGTYTP
jgi:hypothetical protein